MNAIGLIELNSIASGIQVTDVLLKTADVELLVSRSICSGKYMVIIGGGVDSVQSSVDAGLNAMQSQSSIIDSLVIANVHNSIFPAISGANVVKNKGALGIIESFSVASLLEAADAAAKAASVEIVEIRLAMALGGKAFVTLTGDVSAVTAAVESGAAVVSEKGLLVNKVVIPAPSEELFKEYL
ncbi:BMC domain-containing protein [candidate division KSB1 bacterium]|nr:BMC domain-containing protein [candidate division KSB1 bacterium]